MKKSNTLLAAGAVFLLLAVFILLMIVKFEVKKQFSIKANNATVSENSDL